MDINDALARIVAPLRTSIAENRLDATGIAEAACELEAIGFRYNADRFPPLPKEINWGAASPTVPQTLAEALLWKMGAWKKYQNFASHFADERSQSKGTDVVFFAFAKHLRDRANPIYDQHALRALWAIDSSLTEEQSKMCKSVLLARSRKWKATASGGCTVEAYELYLIRVKQLCSRSDSPSPEDLDKLLMPLGQAITAHPKIRILAGEGARMSSIFTLIDERIL